MSDILIDETGGILTITFNRPDALNAVDAAMVTAAADAVESTTARVVLITGAGRAFSSGADLQRLDEGSVQEAGNRLIRAIVAAPRPVVTRVHGPAAGIGMSIALAADVCVAGESAYFLQAFINIGLMPDGGANEIVAASIGRARAERMALLGEKMPARQAGDLGLIGEVAQDDELDASVDGLVQRLASGPTLAYADTKAAINANTLSHLDATLDRELERQTALFETADAQEGIAAFIDKRHARFTAS